MGKGEKFDMFDLAPPLIRAFRLYRHWQLSEAQRNEELRDALADPETAYVLLSRTGRKTPPQTISKIAKWHAVKAGVGVRKSQGTRGTLGGLTSRVSPHAYRRAWATIALNEKELPIDVVSEVLKHADIATTRRHYAPTKSERARAALVGMRLT
jgi:integrase